MTRLFDLTGRLAVVTGARRGIGLAMAEALAEAGADIIGVAPPCRPRAATSSGGYVPAGASSPASRPTQTRRTYARWPGS